jgi:hypothetical protein
MICPSVYVLLIYFISAGFILDASLALMVQFPLPCNKVGRASVLYNFILVLFRVLFGIDTLFIINKNYEKEQQSGKYMEGIN